MTWPLALRLCALMLGELAQWVAGLFPEAISASGWLAIV